MMNLAFNVDVLNAEVARCPQSVWSQLERQIHPFVQVLCITGEVYRMLSVDEKQFIAEKFMNYIKEDVMFCRDGCHEDRFFLGPPRVFVSGNSMLIVANGVYPIWVTTTYSVDETCIVSSTPDAEKKERIPRPPNGFILYRKERHAIVKQSSPGITNNEISQIIGKAWNLETRDVRQKYIAMSDKIKQALLEKYPDYQYRPRKPSEKKRRRRQAQVAQST